MSLTLFTMFFITRKFKLIFILEFFCLMFTVILSNQRKILKHIFIREMNYTKGNMRKKYRRIFLISERNKWSCAVNDFLSRYNEKVFNLC